MRNYNNRLNNGGYNEEKAFIEVMGKEVELLEYNSINEEMEEFLIYSDKEGRLGSVNYQRLKSVGFLVRRLDLCFRGVAPRKDRGQYLRRQTHKFLTS